MPAETKIKDYPVVDCTLIGKRVREARKSSHRSVVFIKYRFLRQLIMLIYKIIKRRTVVGIFTRDVF